MRYAIISDIHGNLEAFRAVLEDVASEHSERIVCLGDIVGYGANPKECIDLASDISDLCVAGNHDWGAAGKTSLSNFNSAAQAAIEWTVSQLTTAQVHFLSSLPLSVEEGLFVITHASPVSPQEWNYIFSTYEASISLQAIERRACFVGHSHVPAIFYRDHSGNVSYTTSFSEVVLQEEKRYLINVGSVGQPRDNDPRAAYGILDADNQTFALRRIRYDITSAQEKIIAAGLPPVLAERIGFGW
jgi:diadenosine tetraphosphatase ApaH/serine/threonine PP2A family protein phosphatase